MHMMTGAHHSQAHCRFHDADLCCASLCHALINATSVKDQHTSSFSAFTQSLMPMQTSSIQHLLVNALQD